MNSKKLLFTTLSLLSIIGYGVFVFAAPPGTGGYNPGETLDPQCTPGDLLPNPCIVKLPSSGSGWSLTGNAGTTAGTNFIGTTDPTDFMVKTNGNQIALFGQNGNVAIGSANVGLGTVIPIASGDNSFAWGAGTQASNTGSTAWGFNNNASASGSTVWGSQSTASGPLSTAWGADSIASGNNSTAFGYGGMRARSFSEVAFGFSGTDHAPGFNTNSVQWSDRLFSVGNGAGLGSEHNAYTLWKDGSFAYNDDNFQNDTPGTEQNMFYFNYGNHDGLGGVNPKRAIRLGSATNDEWDITSANVGNKSIALGFGSIKASGDSSIAFGENTTASNYLSTAFGGGTIASGYVSFVAGDSTTASGYNSTAFGKSTNASGDYSFASGRNSNASGYLSLAMNSGTTASGGYSAAFGANTVSEGETSFSANNGTSAHSFAESAFGMKNTPYVPLNNSQRRLNDRLFIIGNGDEDSTNSTPMGIWDDTSDALTILKSGQTGIAIDNFEANTNGNIFQVGDGTTGIIGYVDNGTGNWVAVSDERKKDNITDLTYGLNELMKLRPTSFNYKRNNEHTIGFLAQQVLPIIPEAVYGTESEGYGMSYTTLTPVIVKAIQEMNLNVTDISNMGTPNTWRDSLITWFESTSNGIRSLVVKDKICVDSECLTKDDIHALLQLRNQMVPPMINIYPPGPSNPPVTNPDPGTPPVDNNSGDTPSEPVVPLSEPTPSDTGSNPLSDPTA